jgi:phage FluMu protein Com
MAVIIACQNCNRKLRVTEEQFGRKIRCPGCKEIFTADPDDSAPAEGITSSAPTRAGEEEGIASRLPSSRQLDREPDEDEDEDDYDDDLEEARGRDDDADGEDRRVKRGRDDDRDLDRIREKTLSPKELKKQRNGGFKLLSLALRLWYFHQLIGLIAPVVLGILYGLLLLIGYSSGSLGVVFAGGLALMALGGLAGLAWFALYITVNILVLFTPSIPKTAIKGLAIATASLGLGGILLELLSCCTNFLTSGFSAFSRGGGGLAAAGLGSCFSAIISLVAAAAFYAHIYVLVCFLRSVALFMKDKVMASEFIRWIIW